MKIIYEEDGYFAVSYSIYFYYNSFTNKFYPVLGHAKLGTELIRSTFPVYSELTLMWL